MFIGLFLGLKTIENLSNVLKVENIYKSSDTDINVHIKHHAIRDIALSIGKNISDNYYWAISTLEKCRKLILSC